VEPDVFYRGSIEALPGEIETLPSGSLRVRVYDRIDPVTRKRRHLTEIIPPVRGRRRKPRRRALAVEGR
jgi:LacI family xylobiose transport system transcriptional regulator